MPSAAIVEKQLKETECYEQGIKGRHLKGSGCWKCRGEAENEIGAIHSVLHMHIQNISFLISEIRHLNSKNSFSKVF